MPGESLCLHVASQGGVVWISYLAMLGSSQPLGRGLFSLTTLCPGTVVPSETPATTRHGTGSPRSSSDPLLEQTAAHPTWEAALMQLLTSDIYSEKLTAHILAFRGYYGMGGLAHFRGAKRCHFKVRSTAGNGVFPMASALSFCL